MASFPNIKKAVILLVIAFSLLTSPVPLGATPSFGTVMPKAGKWQAGGEVNITFDKDVRDYEKAESNQYFYNLSFGFADWFSFDAKLGLGDVTAEPLSGADTYYRVGFAGGYGWRAKLFEDKKSRIKGICAFEHISTHPQRKKIYGIQHDIIWDDWQLELLASKSMGRLEPYCGIKGSLLYLIRKIDGNRTRRSSRDHIGLIIGTDMRVSDYIFVNVEGRFFDETALSTGFTVRY